MPSRPWASGGETRRTHPGLAKRETVGRLHPGDRSQRRPQFARAAGLLADHHAPGILGDDEAPNVGGRVRSEMILVVVTHEDDLGTGGVGGDPVVGAAQSLPLLVRGRQVGP